MIYVYTFNCIKILKTPNKKYSMVTGMYEYVTYHFSDFSKVPVTKLCIHVLSVKTVIYSAFYKPCM